MRRALVVGINDYPTAPLNGCINDAEAFANIIRYNGDESPNFSVKLERDVRRKDTLLKQISNLFSFQGETALFYYSGHGIMNELGGYIVTPDYKKYDEGIPMETILNIANESKARERIIILDCCNAGAFGSSKLLNGASYLKEGVTILTSSLDDESSVEVNGHGVFTNLLLEALKGSASDLKGDITSGSIYAFIDQALSAWQQRPVFKTNVSQFMALRTIPPLVPLDILRRVIKYFPSPESQFQLDPSYEFTADEAIEENVVVMQELQQLYRAGLVIPVGEEFMYFAAVNSKPCRLTVLGEHYWLLAKRRRI